MKLKASLPQKRKTWAIEAEKKKRLKFIELSQEPVSINQVLSFEVGIVLMTPVPTLTLTVDSREEIVKRPQPFKSSAQVGSSKKVDDDEALLDDISEGLFFQD